MPDTKAAAPGPVLMLSTVYANHAARSGYALLSEYIAGAEVLQSPRRDPEKALPLFAARVARQFSFSRWYLGGSAELEFKTLRRLRSGYEGVVHCMWADHDLGFLDLLLDKSRHRLCGTVHNCVDTLRKTIRFPSRLKKFAAIILMSDTQRSYFEEAGVDPSRLHTILHGVDIDYFQPAVTRDSEILRVLSVGGYRRNFPLLASICGSLSDAPGIRFTIIAPKVFRELFATMRNVEFLSGVDDQALLESYRNSSCLLHLAENATANNVVLEAMACGLPIVSEKLGGIPEYVTAGAGILTDQNDPAAVIAALRALHESPARQQEMRASARQRAEALSWQNVARQTVDLYGSL